MGSYNYGHAEGPLLEYLISFLLFIPIFLLFASGKYRLLLIYLVLSLALTIFFSIYVPESNKIVPFIEPLFPPF